MDEVVRQLSVLAASTLDLEAVIRSENAAPERRVAAVLLHVAATGGPLSSSVCELVMSLTEPGWDAQEADPLNSELGRAVRDHLNDEPAKLRLLVENDKAPRVEQAAAQLVLRSVGADYNYNDSLNLVLKAISGRNAVWWIDWISEHRSREKE
jgi:hypothetical protein